MRRYSMRGFRIAVVVATFVASLVVVTAAMGQALPRPETWVDGERFAGVVAPATFDPANGNFDELYMCTDGTTFKDGVPLISESGPGDQDFNGGRWHLNVSTNCDANADSVDDLELGDFTPTSIYFECPLLPRRGKG
jgi:hypothetical protein